MANLPNKERYSRTKSGWFSKGDKLIFMRSSWELNYAHYLDFLVKNKSIKSWEYEVDTFWFEKIRRGIRSYKPDFKIENTNGSIEYHEVKGWMDAQSKTKIKRMKIYHPSVVLKIIAEKEYAAIKKYSAIIPNWGVWIEKSQKPTA